MSLHWGSFLPVLWFELKKSSFLPNIPSERLKSMIYSCFWDPKFSTQKISNARRKFSRGRKTIRWVFKSKLRSSAFKRTNSRDHTTNTDCSTEFGPNYYIWHLKKNTSFNLSNSSTSTSKSRPGATLCLWNFHTSPPPHLFEVWNIFAIQK